MSNSPPRGDQHVTQIQPPLTGASSLASTHEDNNNDASDSRRRQSSHSSSPHESNDDPRARHHTSPRSISHGNSLERTSTARDVTRPSYDMQIQRTTTSASWAGPVHSVFTKNQKRFIVFMAAWAGFFSPVSANIYFPALNPLAQDLHVSDTLINLTLTSYMIFQGLAPTFFGDFADAAGRRPAYAVCFIVYIAANIGLALQNSYAALFLLRCLQSSGSSATIAMCSAVVSDIATAAERGKYMGLTLGGSLLGPAIGPVIGGLLAEYLGWRAIFWFLVILGAAFFVIFGVFFPETARKHVGNGSIQPRGWNMSLMNYLTVRKERRRRLEEAKEADQDQDQDPSSSTPEVELPERPKFRFPNPLRSMYLIFDKENALLLFYNAFLFAAFYDVTAALPSQLKIIFGYSELQIGLCYIPFGFGSMCAALTNGQLLDRNFARWAKKLGLKIKKGRNQDLKNFPIEKARLEIALPAAYCSAALVCVFGWILHINGPLAPLLVVLFFTSLSMSVAFNVTSTLLVDFYPNSPATATAANNVVRCLLGAGATAAVVPMIDSMGRGWTFTFLTVFLVATSPMLWFVYFRGMKWRNERLQKEERAAKIKEANQNSGETGTAMNDSNNIGKEAEGVESNHNFNNNEQPPVEGNISEMAGVVEKEREEEKPHPH
ncbi:MFS-type transporter clz19 [Exophiala dermatitidis]